MFVAEVKASRRADRQALLAAGLVVSDLAMQGWLLRVARAARRGQAAGPVSGDRVGREGARSSAGAGEARRATPSALRAEVPGFDGAAAAPQRESSSRSISLMRDGRELADGLREARAHLNNGWPGALSSVGRSLPGVRHLGGRHVPAHRAAPHGHLALLPPHVDEPVHERAGTDDDVPRPRPRCHEPPGDRVSAR